MQSQQTSLAQRILQTADPAQIGINVLTPHEEVIVSQLVVGVVEDYFNKLAPENNRTQVELSADLLKGVDKHFEEHFSKNMPLKQDEAMRLAKRLLKGWEGYAKITIQRLIPKNEKDK